MSLILFKLIDEDSIRKNIVLSAYDELSISGGIHPLSVSELANMTSVIDYIESNAAKFCAINRDGIRL